MSDVVPVENRANLDVNRFESIRILVESHTTLERALTWFFAQSPSLAPEDLVAQDEFSYDLLVPFRDNIYLSYDTS
jgi:hypothetical protein